MRIVILAFTEVVLLYWINYNWLMIGLDVGQGVFSYNSRRNVFAILPTRGAYHVFTFDPNEQVILLRRTKEDRRKYIRVKLFRFNTICLLLDISKTGWKVWILTLKENLTVKSLFKAHANRKGFNLMKLYQYCVTKFMVVSMVVTHENSLQKSTQAPSK